jgi:hypothetical protein
LFSNKIITSGKTPTRRYADPILPDADTFLLTCCDGDDNDDLALSPVRAADEEWTSFSDSGLGFHDMFGPFDE